MKTPKAEWYRHSADQAALENLKNIPGFSAAVKAVMKSWSEKQQEMLNLSCRVKLGDKQLPDICALLTPICDTLGISVPPLYLERDSRVLSYAWGDEKPFIVLTSGLLETLPRELLPTVLAHECGHIAAGHTLYTTIGQRILNQSGGLTAFVTTPLRMAWAYWMRCSEYTADRAAVICDGSWENTARLCMLEAGLPAGWEGDTEAFIAQGAAYKELLEESKWEQTMEFMLYDRMDHPMTSLRALEIRSWRRSTRYTQLLDRMNGKLPDAETKPEKTASEMKKSASERKSEQEKKTPASGNTSKPVSEENSSPDSLIEKELEELSASLKEDHTGKIQVPHGAAHYYGLSFKTALDELEGSGFLYVKAVPELMKRNAAFRELTVTKILAGETEGFPAGKWLPYNTPITIYYAEFL